MLNVIIPVLGQSKKEGKLLAKATEPAINAVFRRWPVIGIKTARVSRADFTFDPQANQYTCPAGKQLVQFRRSYKTPRTGITSAGKGRNRFELEDGASVKSKGNGKFEIVQTGEIIRKIMQD